MISTRLTLKSDRLVYLWGWRPEFLFSLCWNPAHTSYIASYPDHLVTASYQNHTWVRQLKKILKKTKKKAQNKTKTKPSLTNPYLVDVPHWLLEAFCQIMILHLLSLLHSEVLSFSILCLFILKGWCVWEGSILKHNSHILLLVPLPLLPAIGPHLPILSGFWESHELERTKWKQEVFIPLINWVGCIFQGHLKRKDSSHVSVR